MAYLTISSVHSHVSGNSLRTYTDFFLGSWLLAISMLRPVGGGAAGPEAIKGTATPIPKNVNKCEKMLHVEILHQFSCILAISVIFPKNCPVIYSSTVSWS